MSLFDHKPFGVCVVESCDNDAEEWVGVVTQHGHTTVRKAAALCQAHAAQARGDEEFRLERA